MWYKGVKQSGKFIKMQYADVAGVSCECALKIAARKQKTRFAYQAFNGHPIIRKRTECVSKTIKFRRGQFLRKSI